MTNYQDPIPAPAELANRLFFRLFQTANVLQTQGTRALERYGVTSHQWSVLGALSRPQAQHGMSVGELTRYLKVSRQNLTGILNRLERAGHVERSTDHRDRRARQVRLTPHGEKLWQDLTPAIYQFYDGALQGFSFDDQVAFLNGLNKLQANMSGHTPVPEGASNQLPKGDDSESGTGQQPAIGHPER